MSNPPPAPHDVDQLARSVAMSPSLGQRDQAAVVECLQILAAMLRAAG